MAWVSSSTAARGASRSTGKRASAAAPGARLRAARLARDLSQIALARLAGMHRNSIRKLENGITREVTAENGLALAKALETTVEKLGLRVRPSTGAPSIRLRRLTAEQRQIVNELLSLPPEDYGLIRGAIEKLRLSRKKRRSRGARR